MALFVDEVTLRKNGGAAHISRRLSTAMAIQWQINKSTDAVALLNQRY
jgi:hypothetical protein